MAGGYGAHTTVTVSGLAELRKALLRSGAAAPEEMREVMASVSDVVALKAGANVRHRPDVLARAGYDPGTFADNIRSTTQGEKGVIRVPTGAVPYNRIVEFVEQSPIRRAIASESEMGARLLEYRLTSLFRRHELLAG